MENTTIREGSPEAEELLTTSRCSLFLLIGTVILEWRSGKGGVELAPHMGLIHGIWRVEMMEASWASFIPEDEQIIFYEIQLAPNAGIYREYGWYYGLTCEPPEDMSES